MCSVPWSEEAGHCAGIATGVGIRVEINLYSTAFDAGLCQSDGLPAEMACRTDQPGGIVATSRERLDEGKVTLFHSAFSDWNYVMLAVNEGSYEG